MIEFNEYSIIIINIIRYGALPNYTIIKNIESNALSSTLNWDRKCVTDYTPQHATYVNLTVFMLLFSLLCTLCVVGYLLLFQEGINLILLFAGSGEIKYVFVAGKNCGFWIIHGHTTIVPCGVCVAWR